MTFADLHHGPHPHLLPNAWDVASALAFAEAGFPAVGTTSFGVSAAGQTTVIPDHHGTPMLQVNQSTNRATRQYTDPYGATRGAVVGDADADGRLDGPSPNWVGDHGYLDKPEDASGLTAIGAWMYDPVLGKFISVDPIMDLAEPQQWNAYGYSANNPVTWSDPSGQRYEECGTSHNCTYGKGGNVTSAKKYKKRKPTINDIRSRQRTAARYTTPWGTPMPSSSYYSNPTTYTGHGLTAVGVGVSASAGMASRKSTEIARFKKPQKSSSTPGRQAELNLQRKEVSASRKVIHTHPAVRGAVGIAKNPVAQRAAGPVGVGAGVLIGMPNYHDKNGGDWAFAGMQAGQDATMSVAGGMAGGIVAGLLVAALALTGVGAILLVGGLVAAGATAGYVASQEANKVHSRNHRKSGWW